MGPGPIVQLPRTLTAATAYRRGIVGLVAVACVVYLATYLAAMSLHAPPIAMRALYYVVPLAAVASLSVGGARASGRSRLGLILLAATVACWTGGDLLYTAWGSDPPAIAEIPYYAGYLALATAIPLIGLPRGATPDWRALLDGLAVVAVFGALAWRFLVQPAIADAGDGLQMVLIAGYPVVDMAVMAMLVITLYQRTGGRSAHQFTVLAIAAGVLIATDGGYLTWTLRAEVPDPSLLDLGWLATYCLFGMLPLFRHDAPTRAAKSRAVATFRLALPYAVTIPFAFGAFADASRQGGVPILLTGLIAATSLILVRQWFTLAENVRLRQQAEYLAGHDGLTGLLSREAWFEGIQDAQEGRIAMLDIDHFKRINDMHGHPAGDHVLATVAQRLAATLPSASHLGRVGGEEFAAFFPATDSDVRQECEDALAAVCANPVELADGSQLSISVSVGLADLETGTSALQTYRLADELLYCAKQEGRNRLRSA